MKLQEAQGYLEELDGKSKGYIQQWGLSIAKEAVYTVYHRIKVTPHYKRLAQELYLKVYTSWGL